jgi:hypothetical protein
MSSEFLEPSRTQSAAPSSADSKRLAPLMGSMSASLRAFWNDAPAYQRMAYLVGAGLFATGLVHLVLWAVAGGTASGPLSWRKPATFGISFGLTTVTLAWVATYLAVRHAAGWLLSVLLSVSTTYEVAWVTIQHARGVPSHFNETTALDENLFVLGAVAIVVTNLVVAVITLATFLRTKATPTMALSIRSGMVALLIGQIVGNWMLDHGLRLVDAGVDPLTQSMTTYGAAGAMKFAHAVPMHAIQVFGALAWLLSFSRLTQPRQLHMVMLAIIGYAGFFGVTLLRTAKGDAPFDPPGGVTALYVMAAAFLAGPLVAAVVSLRNPRSAA